MGKNGFTIIEVTIVFLLILGITFFILPKSLNTTKQARFISQWSAKYSELEYMMSVIKAQNETQVKAQVKNATNNQEKREIILETIKPYLRINSNVEVINYKQHYMNGNPVPTMDRYFFNNFYYTASGEIIGLKWSGSKCADESVCTTMSFDLNGAKQPNSWGIDIFGVEVLNDKISPLGENAPPDELRTNCSKQGYGTYCSYYYLMGGRFD